MIDTSSVKKIENFVHLIMRPFYKRLLYSSVVCMILMTRKTLGVMQGR
jgi:hypothetical protein